MDFKEFDCLITDNVDTKTLYDLFKLQMFTEASKLLKSEYDKLESIDPVQGVTSEMTVDELNMVILATCERETVARCAMILLGGADD